MGGRGRPATWNGEETGSLAPPAPDSRPVMDVGLQLVGLNSKPGRSMITLICPSCSGMPLSSVGIGSLVIVTDALFGSTLIAERTITFPRSNGPATAGATIERPYGAFP